MKTLLLAVLSALAPVPVRAADVDAPGAAAVKARRLIEGLPAEAKVELRRAWFRYREQVAKRLDQGWEPGTLSDAVIEDVGEPFLPARQLEDAEKNRLADLKDLRASLDKTSKDVLAYGRIMHKIEDKKAALAQVRRELQREKGVCRDWSDDVWHALTALNLEHWTFEDRRRDARPFHTAAVGCAGGGDADDGGHAYPRVCLAFDPWAEGKPEAYAEEAWDAKDLGGRFPPEYFIHGLPEKVP